MPEECPYRPISQPADKFFADLNIGSVPVHADAVQQRRRAFVNKRCKSAAESSWCWVCALLEAVRSAQAQALVIEGLDSEMAFASLDDRDVDRFWREFYRALVNGIFGSGRRCRVMMMSPDFGPWRLTPSRAMAIVESRGWREFVQLYARFAWIEADRAENWLYTWLDPQCFGLWLSGPNAQEALAARRARIVRTTATPSSATTPVTAVIDPLVNKVRFWFSGIVVGHVNRGERLTKELAFKLAFAEFPEINRHWFEKHIYRPPIVPGAWTRSGRPRGSLNKKGK